MLNARKSFITDCLLLVLLAAIFLSVCIVRRHGLAHTIVASDPMGYYIYLPAVFVHKNIHKVPDKLFQGQTKNEKGETYTKYPCGTAYCYLPFFLAAHGYAYLCGLDMSGFSRHYYYAMMMCGVFWAFLGVYFLMILLSRYFSRVVTWITILCIILGTNFFNYASFEVTMSHVYSFTLFAAILFAADSYYKAPSKKLAALIGALVGWMLLIRNLNIVMLIFPALLNVVTIKDLKQRISFFLQHYGHILLAVLCCIIISIPQLLYWKEMTGHWLTYSYKGEAFIYLAHPKIAEVLFDTQNGLFTYSPILLFFLWGLFMKRNDPRTNFWGVSIVFVIITYLFASWWAWWFGAAFGHRCYVEYFTILAFPLAITVERILAIKKRVAMLPFFFLMALFCYYNIYLSELYMNIGIFDGPSWQWNWDKWYNDLVRRIF